MRLLISQLARFGVVGAVGFVIDTVIFNVLLATTFSTDSNHEGPLWAKVISTSVAIVVNWIGNRYWTFRKEERRHPVSESIEFFVVSLVGLGIGLGCLWISHYALGLTSPLDDNISANVIGLGLGTVFRFALYRLWVFNPRRGSAQRARRVRKAAETGSLGSTEASV
ncbi:MAG: GtrA family protein [Glaciihabitans sp.]|jgi:putative flippase GtrA|nr:GtrA family protein [Glaciihabitans sp.]